MLDFLKDEPVQGELLADRLAPGPLPEPEALDLAARIGTALGDLHARGRVHGRLSPHAIGIDGKTVRILQPDASSLERDQAYLSPEQRRGQAPDSRSDIYAYGMILRNIAAAADSLLSPVIESCILEDPAKRRQRVQNAVIELKLARRNLARPAAAHIPAPEQVRPAAPHSRSRTVLVIGLLLIAAAAVSLAGIVYLHRQDAPYREFSEASPAHMAYPGTPAVSPDGSALAFSARGPDGQRMLWLRTFDEVSAHAIPGTEGGVAPFWSPDGRQIGFFAHNSLSKVRVAGEQDNQPQVLYAADFEPGGGTWNRDGTILFSPNLNDGIFRISSNGGGFAPVLALRREQGQVADLWPQFLPDGKHFLYFGATDKPETTGIYVAGLDGSGQQFLLRSTTNAVYSPGAASENGYLLFMRDRDLMMQAFDASKLAVQGDATVRVPDIGAIETLSLAPISVSGNGVLVYQAAGKPTRQLMWMDRAGKPLGAPLDAGQWGSVRIAPDGARAAAARLNEETKSGEIWILGSSGPAVQFDSGLKASVDSPVWSPDGSAIAFSGAPDRMINLYVKPLTGGRAELVHRSDFAKYPVDWSHDARWLLFAERTSDTGVDIWADDLLERQARPIIATIRSEIYAALSPDRKWLAYQTDVSGHYEVVVRAWNGGSRESTQEWQVSQGEGGVPHWRADGAELFYITPKGSIMAVAVRKSVSGFEFDKPQQILRTRTAGTTWNLYDVSPDGQKFLVNVPLEWSNSALITITNWTEKPSNN